MAAQEEIKVHRFCLTFASLARSAERRNDHPSPAPQIILP
jgi:hypothetical protein